MAIQPADKPVFCPRGFHLIQIKFNLPLADKLLNYPPALNINQESVVLLFDLETGEFRRTI